MHTTLYFYLCVQFLQLAACLLLVYFASHSEVPLLQFLFAFPTAVSGFMRLCCSGSRYPCWPSGLHIAACHRIILNINAWLGDWLFMPPSKKVWKKEQVWCCIVKKFWTLHWKQCQKFWAQIVQTFLQKFSARHISQVF